LHRGTAHKGINDERQAIILQITYCVSITC
jgi:hypothetical protein